MIYYQRLESINNLSHLLELLFKSYVRDFSEVCREMNVS